MISSGKRKIMNTTERESPLKSPSKIWKSEIENLRKKKSLKIQKERAHIVARMVRRLARNSHESAGVIAGL